MKHNNASSLWLVVHNKVYDVTRFMEEVSLRSVSKIINEIQLSEVGGEGVWHCQ